MREIRDVLRLKYGLDRSNWEIGAIDTDLAQHGRQLCPAGAGSGRVLAAAGRVGRREAGSGAVSGDSAVAGSAAGARLGAGALGAGAAQRVTLQLPRFEYREPQADGYQYSRLCELAPRPDLAPRPR